MPQWTLTHTGIDQVHSEFGKGHQHFNNFTSLKWYCGPGRFKRTCDYVKVFYKKYHFWNFSLTHK